MIAKATLVRWLVACLACALSTGVLAAARDYQLPTIGQPADQYMSPAEADKLGRQVVAQLLERGLIIEDPVLSEYLNRMGSRLVQHTTARTETFRFYVIDSNQVNAFALPGGYIGVNAGLITETDNESELGGVMAHEIAHVTQRHIARQIQATSGAGWTTMAAILVAAIAGGGDPDAISAAVTAGVSSLGQQQTNFTRAHEYEADRLGIRTLAASGYDPEAVASFFEKMERRSRLYGDQLPQILLSHPVSSTRMAEAESRAQDYPSPEVRESNDYAPMKERARVLAARQAGQLLEYYQQQRRAAGASPALDYGYALALTRLGRTSDAIDLLVPLVDAHPGQSPYLLALAHAYSQAGQLDQAESLLTRARKRFPDSTAAKLDYAEVLMERDDSRAVRDYLLGQTKLLSRAPEAQRMLAQAAGKQNNLGEAYYRQAKYYAMRGAYAQAINQLRTALQTADLVAFDKARLRAELDHTIQACHQAWSQRECRERVTENSQF